MRQAIVIVGFAGIGKTYCGNKYSNVKDFDHLRYLYSYSPQIIEQKNFEELKGLENARELNPAWPDNYFRRLSQYINEYDVVLLPASDEVIEYLDRIHFEYTLCYPDIKSKQIYLERYQKRGTNQEWIHRINQNFENNIRTFENKKVKKIVLKEHETLEDKLKEMGLLKNAIL